MGDNDTKKGDPVGGPDPVVTPAGGGMPTTDKTVDPVVEETPAKPGAETPATESTPEPTSVADTPKPVGEEKKTEGGDTGGTPPPTTPPAV